MDCARFENELVFLLDDAVGEQEHRARAEALLRHVETCTACRGSRELVETLLLPPGERDPVPEPDDAYWASFSRRLAERIRREEERQRSRRVWVSLGSVAALALLALAAWAFFRPSADVPPPSDPEVVRQGPGEQPEPGISEEPTFPEALEQRLRQAGPTEAVTAMRLLVGHEDEWLTEPEDGAGISNEENGWLFPGTESLDVEGRRALLDWIREQEERPQGEQA